MEITVAIDKSALAKTLPVQGGEDGYSVYMHSTFQIFTKTPAFELVSAKISDAKD